MYIPQKVSEVTILITNKGLPTNYFYHKFLLTSCSKRLRMRNWDTIQESHRRLDKTMYGESSVKVSR